MEFDWLAFFHIINDGVDELIGNNAYRCSATSHALLYSTVAMYLVGIGAGIWMWRRISEKSKKQACCIQDD